MTDYNDTDTEEIKKQSDWYKVINLFSWNKWDIHEWMELFWDMSWCDGMYWTATKYKNEKWEELEGIVCTRLFNKYDYKDKDEDEDEDNGFRYWEDEDEDYHFRVCGFKDFM
jgi:hypothetical protein